MAEVGKPGTNWTQISPEHRKQMAPLVEYYRKKPHPFTACVRDNRKRFGPRAEQVCAVVKDVIEQGTHWRAGAKKLAEEQGLTHVLPEPALTPAELVALVALSETLGDRAYAELTARTRKNLKRSQFAIPESRSYPIHDRRHGGLALGRASGKPEYGRVRAAVCRLYSDLPECKARSMTEIAKDAERDREYAATPTSKKKLPFGGKKAVPFKKGGGRSASPRKADGTPRGY